MIDPEKLEHCFHKLEIKQPMRKLMALQNTHKPYIYKGRGEAQKSCMAQQQIIHVFLNIYSEKGELGVEL